MSTIEDMRARINEGVTTMVEANGPRGEAQTAAEEIAIEINEVQAAIDGLVARLSGLKERLGTGVHPEASAAKDKYNQAQATIMSVLEGASEDNPHVRFVTNGFNAIEQSSNAILESTGVAEHTLEETIDLLRRAGDTTLGAATTTWNVVRQSETIQNRYVSQTAAAAQRYVNSL
jgi:hypothetical protein